MHQLSAYQKKKLLQNPNVEKITEKHLVFTAKFKLFAVKQALKGICSDSIFESEGINTQFFKPNYSQYCIKKWKKKYLDYGEDAFKDEHRGSGNNGKTGRPKKPTYEELEAIVAIQREALGYAKK